MNDSREVSSTFLQILLRVLPMSNTSPKAKINKHIFWPWGFLDFLLRTEPSSNFFWTWTGWFLENSSRSFTKYGWIFQKSVWPPKTEMSEKHLDEFSGIFQYYFCKGKKLWKILCKKFWNQPLMKNYSPYLFCFLQFFSLQKIFQKKLLDYPYYWDDESPDE